MDKYADVGPRAWQLRDIEEAFQNNAAAWPAGTSAGGVAAPAAVVMQDRYGPRADRAEEV